MMKWSTIKDIANGAEVLPNTIHGALMVRKGVSGAARRKITAQPMIDDMSFYSGLVAASLRHMILNIGTVFPSIPKENRSFYSNMWQCVFDYIDFIRDFDIRFIRIPHFTAFPGNKADNLKNITDSGRLRRVRQNQQIIGMIITEDISERTTGETPFLLCGGHCGIP